MVRSLLDVRCAVAVPLRMNKKRLAAFLGMLALEWSGTRLLKSVRSEYVRERVERKDEKDGKIAVYDMID